MPLVLAFKVNITSCSKFVSSNCGNFLEFNSRSSQSSIFKIFFTSLAQRWPKMSQTCTCTFFLPSKHQNKVSTAAVADPETRVTL